MSELRQKMLGLLEDKSLTQLIDGLAVVARAIGVDLTNDDEISTFLDRVKTVATSGQATFKHRAHAMTQAKATKTVKALKDAPDASGSR